MLTLIISILLNFTFGASTPDNTTNSGEPLFTAVLSDSLEIDILEVVTDSASFTVKFGYISEQVGYLNRIVKIDRKMAGVALFDKDGQPLTGYKISDEDKEKQKFSLLMRDDALGIEADFENDKDITMRLTKDNKTEKVKFRDLVELDSCAAVYRQVKQNELSRETLSKRERKLLDKAEKIYEWGNNLELPSFDEDIKTADRLVENKEFRKWLKESYDK